VWFFAGILLLTSSSQAPLRAFVIDISKDDAIYEDVSRQLAQDLSDHLQKEGLVSIRLDERELPDGCRLGPCLAQVAKEKNVQVVVTLDAKWPRLRSTRETVLPLLAPVLSPRAER
jgi:hypothetical protein